tara:strand:- start:3291 stop:4184 length:894 start_codon:yes stop_codon:yes gene_type:complete
MIIKSVSKNFFKRTIFKRESVKILKDINFNLNEGDIFGITGPNGAGKTTLFKIILNLIEPSSGKIDIDHRGSKYLAYVNTNSRSFFWRLSSRENLIFHGKLLDLPLNEISKSINTLSEKFDVNGILDTPFMKLSSGQMQIMIIIRALLKEPDYLIFDEATSSMDVEKSTKVLNVIKKFIKKNNIPTIWCSHNLEEIEFMCNKFSILKKGKLKLLSTNDFKNFKKSISSHCFEISKSDLDKLIDKAEIEIVNEFKSTYHVKFIEKSISLNACIRLLFDLNIDIVDIVNTKKSEHFIYE